MNEKGTEYVKQLTEREWFRLMYEKEVGPPPPKSQEPTLTEVLNALKEQATNKKVKAAKYIRKVPLKEENLLRVDCKIEPPMKYCGCPVTKCICNVTRLLGEQRIPRGTRYPRSCLCRTFDTLMGRRKRPRTFFDKLSTAIKAEIAVGKTFDTRGLYEQRGPEYCMGGCQRFYVPEKKRKIKGYDSKVSATEENNKYVVEMRIMKDEYEKLQEASERYGGVLTQAEIQNIVKNTPYAEHMDLEISRPPPEVQPDKEKQRRPILSIFKKFSPLPSFSNFTDKTDTVNSLDFSSEQERRKNKDKCRNEKILKKKEIKNTKFKDKKHKIKKGSILKEEKSKGSNLKKYDKENRKKEIENTSKASNNAWKEASHESEESKAHKEISFENVMSQSDSFLKTTEENISNERKRVSHESNHYKLTKKGENISQLNNDLYEDQWDERYEVIDFDSEHKLIIPIKIPSKKNKKINKQTKLNENEVNKKPVTNSPDYEMQSTESKKSSNWSYKTRNLDGSDITEKFAEKNETESLESCPCRIENISAPSDSSSTRKINKISKSSTVVNSVENFSRVSFTNKKTPGKVISRTDNSKYNHDVSNNGIKGWRSPCSPHSSIVAIHISETQLKPINIINEDKNINVPKIILTKSKKPFHIPCPNRSFSSIRSDKRSNKEMTRKHKCKKEKDTDKKIKCPFYIPRCPSSDSNKTLKFLSSASNTTLLSQSLDKNNNDQPLISISTNAPEYIHQQKCQWQKDFKTVKNVRHPFCIPRCPSSNVINTSINKINNNIEDDNIIEPAQSSTPENKIKNNIDEELKISENLSNDVKIQSSIPNKIKSLKIPPKNKIKQVKVQIKVEKLGFKEKKDNAANTKLPYKSNLNTIPNKQTKQDVSTETTKLNVEELSDKTKTDKDISLTPEIDLENKKLTTVIKENEKKVIVKKEILIKIPITNVKNSMPKESPGILESKNTSTEKPVSLMLDLEKKKQINDDTVIVQTPETDMKNEDEHPNDWKGKNNIGQKNHEMLEYSSDTKTEKETVTRKPTKVFPEELNQSSSFKSQTEKNTIKHKKNLPKTIHDTKQKSERLDCPPCPESESSTSSRNENNTNKNENKLSENKHDINENRERNDCPPCPESESSTSSEDKNKKKSKNKLSKILHHLTKKRKRSDCPPCPALESSTSLSRTSFNEMNSKLTEKIKNIKDKFPVTSFENIKKGFKNFKIKKASNDISSSSENVGSNKSSKGSQSTKNNDKKKKGKLSEKGVQSPTLPCTPCLGPKKLQSSSAETKVTTTYYESNEIVNKKLYTKRKKEKSLKKIRKSPGPSSCPPCPNYIAPCPPCPDFTPCPPCPSGSTPCPPCPKDDDSCPPCPKDDDSCPPCPGYSAPCPPCPREDGSCTTSPNSDGPCLPYTRSNISCPPCPSVSAPCPPCPRTDDSCPPCPNVGAPCSPCPRNDGSCPPYPDVSSPCSPCSSVVSSCPPCPKVGAPCPPCPIVNKVKSSMSVRSNSNHVPNNSKSVRKTYNTQAINKNSLISSCPPCSNSSDEIVTNLKNKPPKKPNTTRTKGQVNSFNVNDDDATKNKKSSCYPGSPCSSYDAIYGSRSRELHSKNTKKNKNIKDKKKPSKTKLSGKNALQNKPLQKIEIMEQKLNSYSSIIQNQTTDEIKKLNNKTCKYDSITSIIDSVADKVRNFTDKATSNFDKSVDASDKAEGSSSSLLRFLGFITKTDEDSKLEHCSCSDDEEPPQVGSLCNKYSMKGVRPKDVLGPKDASPCYKKSLAKKEIDTIVKEKEQYVLPNLSQNLDTIDGKVSQLNVNKNNKGTHNITSSNASSVVMNFFNITRCRIDNDKESTIYSDKNIIRTAQGVPDIIKQAEMRDVKKPIKEITVKKTESSSSSATQDEVQESVDETNCSTESASNQHNISINKVNTFELRRLVNHSSFYSSLKTLRSFCTKAKLKLRNSKSTESTDSTTSTQVSSSDDSSTTTEKNSINTQTSESTDSTDTVVPCDSHNRRYNRSSIYKLKTIIFGKKQK